MRKGIIVRNPLSIPRIAVLADGIIDTGDLDIIEVLRHLMEGIVENLLDRDHKEPFEPMQFYTESVSHTIDDFRTAFDENYDPDEEGAPFFSDAIVVAFTTMHALYYPTFKRSVVDARTLSNKLYSYSICGVDGARIEEAAKDADILINLIPKFTQKSARGNPTVDDYRIIAFRTGIESPKLGAL